MIDRHGKTALFYAALRGCTAIVRALVAAGANPEVGKSSWEPNSGKYDRALHVAAAKGFIDIPKANEF